MKLSVIVITLNEENYIGNLLGDLQRESLPSGSEVLVIDGGSTDNTKRVVAGYKETLPVRFVSAPKRGYAAQKNYGAATAKNNVLLYIDADIRLPKGTIRQLTELHTQHPDKIVVPRITADSARLHFRVGAYLTHSYFALLTKLGTQAASDQCMIVSKKLYMGLGGIDETLPHAGDLDFMKRAKHAGTRLHVAKKVTAATSMRRFEEVGTTRLLGRYVRSEIHRHRNKGKIKKDYVGYTKEK
jgi:glycosyltransferase involved in cell wall biosynthesis